MDAVASNLQASIRALVNERRELQSRLMLPKRWQNNNRSLKPTTPESRKRVITDPVLEATNVTLGERTSPEYPVEKRPKVELDDSTIKRTKNMFGSLLGHLQKAKIRLDDEKTTRPAELQRAVSAQVTQKLELERKNLAELRRRDFHEQHQKNMLRMKEIQKELQLTEANLLKLNLQHHYTPMKNFIRTDSIPVIFWSPARHNEVTIKLRDTTKAAIEAKIESLAEKFTSIVEERWALIDQRRALIDTNQNESSNKEQSEPAPMHPDLINDSDDDDDDDDDEDMNQDEDVEDKKLEIVPQKVEAA